LIIGLTIYILFRKDTYLTTILQKFDLAHIISSVKNKIILPNNIFTNFVIYNLVDGLWIYSFAWAAWYFVQRKTKILLMMTTVSAFLFSLLIELLQFYRIISGTIDIIDIVCYCIAVIVSYSAIKKKEGI